MGVVGEIYRFLLKMYYPPPPAKKKKSLITQLLRTDSFTSLPRPTKKKKISNLVISLQIQLDKKLEVLTFFPIFVTISVLYIKKKKML